LGETDFTSHPKKDRTKKIVSLTRCSVKPAPNEKDDRARRSLAATINFSMKPLKLMSLAKTQIPFNDSELQGIREDMVVCKTRKAYQTHQSMTSYIIEILTPNCEQLRNELGDGDLPVFLIMDNCSSHNTALLLAMSEEIGVTVILLPPHSSHFLQPLDPSILRKVKQSHAGGFPTTTKPKAEGKILLIHEAQHHAAFTTDIGSTWASAAIRVNYGHGPEWCVDDRNVASKLREQVAPATPKRLHAVGH
jgi:hypothetical protein